MHVAGASWKTNVLKSREGESLVTNELSTEPTGGSTRGGMSSHVASKGESAFSAKFAKGEELKTEEKSEPTAGSSVLGVDGRDMFG